VVAKTQHKTAVAVFVCDRSLALLIFSYVFFAFVLAKAGLAVSVGAFKIWWLLKRNFRQLSPSLSATDLWLYSYFLMSFLHSCLLKQVLLRRLIVFKIWWLLKRNFRQLSLSLSATAPNFSFNRIFTVDSRAIMLTFAYAFDTKFKGKLMDNQFSND
jgi:hypothetical protein